MTVISANCVGAFILHDLHQPFNSPFVNLYLSPQDFFALFTKYRFLPHSTSHIRTNRKKVIQWENLPILKFILCIITVSKKLMKKWQLRTSRMKLDNLFIMMTDRDGVTEKDIQLFDQLPFKK